MILKEEEIRLLGIIPTWVDSFEQARNWFLDSPLNNGGRCDQVKALIYFATTLSEINEIMPMLKDDAELAHHREEILKKRDEILARDLAENPTNLESVIEAARLARSPQVRKDAIKLLVVIGKNDSKRREAVKNYFRRCPDTKDRLSELCSSW